ncbi:Asp23/Gls24 family envelope stress response protein [Arthrobacter sp. I2-34]|uniref:Asp23/Gls24 family envelope stress response protein n=1 Tax=Arthrobacter hankyongi TaxID=2904801 RepID=A0ABS9LCG5_9MICC|nr:Asp23/Gls24 family envelope stress response protein [Arthrobacter hankyongi]MCG2624372.1 Asp23/Gls24 family envelope stress response protein [Arthrobacter hankyongi]
MALDDNIPRLGCGRSIDEVWTTIDQPPNAHEQDCDQCRTARASLAQLSEATRTMRGHDEEDPGLQPRSAVKDAIMSLARAEVRRGNRIPIHQVEQGVIEVSEQAISTVIWFGADALPGVRARRCRVHPDYPDIADNPGPPARTAGLTVDLRIAVATGTYIPEAAHRLRQRITGMITAHVGLNAGTINIVVEDLYDV